MADPVFFHNAGSVTLNALTALTGASATLADGSAPDPLRTFHDVAPLDRATLSDISFLDNAKYIGQFSASRAGACFVRKAMIARAPLGMVLLITDNPYAAYALAAQHFYPQPLAEPGISERAAVAPSAEIGEGVEIAPGVVIGERVRIGARSHIGANTVIDAGVTLGEDCHIGSNCTLSYCHIGHRTILHGGVRIGQDGFGFAASARGAIKVPQLGRVLIGDDVEIGANSCVDRGAGPDTIIGAGSKIDNLVQIAHNVQIGRSVMIAAQCGISGSTTIGDGVQLGGQAGITGHLHIGARARVAAQAGVITDVPPGATYGGAPALNIRDWHRQTVTLTQLANKGKEPSDE